MSWNRFAEFYKRVGFWKFWIAVLGIALVAYSLFLVFITWVGPYVVGLWLLGEIG